MTQIPGASAHRTATRIVAQRGDLAAEIPRRSRHRRSQDPASAEFMGRRPRYPTASVFSR